MHYLPVQRKSGESSWLKFMEIYGSFPGFNCLLLSGQSGEVVRERSPSRWPTQTEGKTARRRLATAAGRDFHLALPEKERRIMRALAEPLTIYCREARRWSCEGKKCLISQHSFHNDRSKARNIILVFFSFFFSIQAWYWDTTSPLLVSDWKGSFLKRSRYWPKSQHITSVN